MPAHRIHFGILGTASIARALIGERFHHVDLAAVASRDINKANAFADEANIPLRYQSYDALIADPTIEAVYIPLPQHLHYEYAIKSAKAHKHVLVEKPAALNTSEIERISEACKSNDVLFMEGFMYRFKRVHNRAKEIVQEGTIGKLRFVNFAWSHNIGNRGHDGFRLEKHLGGGCLLDLGVYGADWIRFITDAEPRLFQSYLHRREEDGLDLFAHATYKAGDVLATITCGYTADANYYFLSGEKGSIYSPVALSGRKIPNVLQIHLLGSDTKYSEEFPAENAYKLELEYFAQCIKNKQYPFLDAENARRNLLLIEELAENAIII
jgi:D-xylose 1-dehydrogenase (NADP+, D-xylono-1,5-lactone-forming)